MRVIEVVPLVCLQVLDKCVVVTALRSTLMDHDREKLVDEGAISEVFCQEVCVQFINLFDDLGFRFYWLFRTFFLLNFLLLFV